jgi:hypothetical protein
MSKKLLEESTIRSFMKLANLQPLSEKFISENYGMKKEEEHDEEEDEEDEDDKKKVDESAPPDTEETAHSRGRLEEEEELEEGEEPLEEVAQEEGEAVEEGKESEGRPASPKQKVAGVAKPSKVKGAHADHKMKAMSTGTHHSDKPDSIETKGRSNAPKKNNSQFEIVSESLEEEMDEAGDEGSPSDAAGEGGDHQAKMKELIRGMLNTLKDMGEEYGMTMEVSDEGAAGDEEMAGPEGAAAPSPEGEEDEGMMQEKLDEMVEKLTKRVAARLVKESKKKR